MTTERGGPAVPGAAQGRTTEAKAWIDFRAVNQAALCRLPKVLERWLPGGICQGGEYTALNPTRVDRHLGSFRINIRTGRWADFATGDRGGDVISLAAYLFRLSQVEAARRLAGVVGMNRNERD